MTARGRDGAKPRTRGEVLSAEAQAAFERGMALLAEGSAGAALPWLERARRIARADDTVAFALAAALLASSRPEARSLLEDLAKRHDTQPLWKALAAARQRDGDWPGAADAQARLRQLPVVEGCVAPTPEGGIAGWAWLPSEPDRAPVLTVTPTGRTPFTVTAREDDPAPARPLTRPRRIAIPPSALADSRGPVSVTGPDGRELAGSPLEPGRERRAAADAARAVARVLPLLGLGRAREVPWQPLPAALRGDPAAAPAVPDRPVCVVIPAYRGAELTAACLAAVRATVPRNTTVIAVDDASPERDLKAMLDAAAARGEILLIRHARNRGFPESANAGLREAAALPDAPDVVLLNNDAIPTPGWLERLRAAVHAAPGIGTACPLSNDASILGYPDPAKPGPAPSGEALAALAKGAADALDGATIEIPTAVGFCMYIRRECLLATGLFRADIFAQGYGEENDFCLRARRLGWQHVAVPGAFVAHAAGTSFGSARTALLARNLDVLERLYPGYQALIAAWQAADPLAPARRALDTVRFRAAQSPGAQSSGAQSSGAVLLVTHDAGGGVARVVEERIAALAAQGVRAILLRPVVATTPDPVHPTHRYVPGLVLVGTEDAAAFPNLRFRLPDELTGLAALLRGAKPARMEVHHLIGLDHSVLELAARLRIPYELHVHDYATFCPRVTLIGRERRYCGEPHVSVCEACVADLGSALEEPIGPRELRARSAGEFAAAARVVVPSHDVAARLGRHFPAVVPDIRPLEDDAALPPLRRLRSARPRRVGIIGAIGTAKGYEVVLEAARDAAARDVPLSFVVVGHTEDDARLMDTGRAFVTGPYREDEAVDLVAAQTLDLVLLPSVWPETWCFALGVAWRAGLAAAVFDLGAPAERVRATGRGWLLPLGLSPRALNTALLALQDPVIPRQPAALQQRTADVSLPRGAAVAASPSNDVVTGP